MSIADDFYEMTGLNAVVVSEVYFGEYVIEASDGNTYHVYPA